MKTTEHWRPILEIRKRKTCLSCSLRAEHREAYSLLPVDTVNVLFWKFVHIGFLSTLDQMFLLILVDFESIIYLLYI